MLRGGRAAWRCVVASGPGAVTAWRSRALGGKVAGQGRGAAWTRRERRGARAREEPRKLSLPRARRPAPQPAFPARAERRTVLGSQEVGGERARAGPGGGAPAGRGWAGGCAWVSVCDPRGAGAELPTSEVKRRRSGRRAPRRREHGAPALDYSEDPARGRPTASQGFRGAHRAASG